MFEYLDLNQGSCECNDRYAQMHTMPQGKPWILDRRSAFLWSQQLDFESTTGKPDSTALPVGLRLSDQTANCESGGNCLPCNRLSNSARQPNGQIALGGNRLGRCHHLVALGFDDGGVGIGAAGVYANTVAGVEKWGRCVHAQPRAKTHKKSRKNGRLNGHFPLTLRRLRATRAYRA